MDRTRTAFSAEQQPEPPVTAPMRGRGRGRGRARGRGRGRAQPMARAAAPAVEPQIDIDEEVPAQTFPIGPAQVPEGFIATLVLPESVAQTGTFPMAPAVSQAGGGAQTPTTPAPEQIALQYQAPAAQPIGLVQPVIAAQVGDGPAMSSEALWRLDRFTKLFPIHFSGSPSKDP